MHKRLKKLEGRTGDPDKKITVIFWVTVSPSPDGPRSKGINTAHVVGGGSFWRKDYVNDEAFKDAVDAAHVKEHGQSVDWDGQETCDVGQPSDAAEPAKLTSQKQGNTK